MGNRGYASIFPMLRSKVEQMDGDNCKNICRVISANIDNALWWVASDDEAYALADAITEAADELARLLLVEFKLPKKVIAGQRSSILSAVERFEKYLDLLPTSVEAEALANLEASLFPVRPR